MQSHNLPSESIEQEIINRLQIRKKMCFKGENLNPYYIKGQKPEHVEIQEKIDELKLKIKS